MNLTNPTIMFRGVGICRSCGGQAPEATICDECDARRGASPMPPAQRTVSPLNIGDDWPRKHRRRLTQGFSGAALDKAKELWPRIFAGQMLMLHGPQGRGKTGMAVWWEWQRQQEGSKPGLYLTAQGLFRKIKSSWPKNEEEAVIRELRNVPYLVLDEMDERAESAWEEYTLFDILNHRYNDERATVLISNLTATELAKTYRPKLQARISENGGVVECGWESYRG